MKSALIVSNSDQNVESIAKLLKMISCKNISTVKTCGDARRMTLENSYDLYIINSPINNESGENLVKDLILDDVCQVIFIVKTDIYDYMSGLVEDLGVITISKPLTKNMLWMALKLSKASHARLSKIKKQNDKLSRRIDDIKTVDRAKYILISHLNMNETEAHKYIEKKAMDTRVSRREIAESILRTYES